MFAKVKPNTQFIGQNIIYFNQVDSTNQFAIDLIKQNIANHGDVVITDYQSAGKGQNTKSWVSSANQNLLFSIILRPVTNWQLDPFIINKTIAIALQSFLKAYLNNLSVQIKWPNDILVNNKKISGILIENNFSGNKLNFSIIGIGLNINQSFEDNKQIDGCSISELLNHKMDRPLVFKNFLEHLEPFIVRLSNKEKSDEYTRLYDKNLIGYNIVNLFEINNKIQAGIVKSCDEFGRLVLEIDGENKAFLHGQIKQFLS